METDGFTKLPNKLTSIANVNQSVAINSQQVTVYNSPMNLDRAERLDEERKFNSTLLPSLKHGQVGGGIEAHS